MPSKTRTSPLPVRLPVGMKESLDKAAASQGITRNALIVRSLERTLGMQHEDDELPAEAHVCRHDKSKLKVIGPGAGFGTFCDKEKGGCGARVR